MDNLNFRRNRKLIPKQLDDTNQDKKADLSAKQQIQKFFDDEIQYLLFNSRCHDSGESVNFDSARQFKEEFMRINNKKNDDTLCLQSMRLGVNSVIVLGNILAQRNVIHGLQIRDNLVSDYGMNAIKNIISNCSIVSLNIGSNMISEMGLETIVDDLIKNTVLKHLDLGVVEGSPRKNSIKTQGAKYIAAILLHNKSIESLALQDNDINWEGLEIIGASLKENDTLRKLKVSENGVNSDSLQFILNNGYNLSEIDVSKNKISSKGGYQLRYFIENSQKIQSLNLEYNQLYCQGVQQIAEAIKEDTQLNSLNLRGNNINDKGLEYLITRLRNNRYMKKLDISQNMLTAMGIEKLACIISTTNLEHLNIGNNNLGDESLIYLGDQLNNRIEIVRLQCLDISGAKIGDKGILYFLQQIQSNQELKYLLANNNFISEQVSKFLITHLSQNKSLLKFQLQENRLSISCLRKINNILNRNKQLLVDEQPRKLQDDVNQLKFEQKKLQEMKNKIKKQQKDIAQLEEFKCVIQFEYDRQMKNEHQIRNQSSERIKQQVNGIEQKKLIIQNKEKEYMNLRKSQEDQLLDLRTKLKREQEKEQELEKELEMLNKDMEFQDINFEKNIRELNNQVKQLKQEGDIYDQRTQDLNEQYQYLLTNKDYLVDHQVSQINDQSFSSSSSQDDSPKLQVKNTDKRTQHKSKTYNA